MTRSSPSNASHNIGALANHLPREDVAIEPATDVCPCCQGKLQWRSTGSDEGRERWAKLASLINIAKPLGIDSQTYLTDVLERFVSGRTKVNILHELLSVGVEGVPCHVRRCRLVARCPANEAGSRDLSGSPVRPREVRTGKSPVFFHGVPNGRRLTMIPR